MTGAETKSAAPSLATTADGRFALALIDDFLRYHRLESTASTAAAEIVGYGERAEPATVAADLRLSPSPHDQPLLMQLISAHRSGAKGPSPTKPTVAPITIPNASPSSLSPSAGSPTSPSAPSAAAQDEAKPRNALVGGARLPGGPTKMTATGGPGRKPLPSLAPLKGVAGAGAADEEFARSSRLAAEEAAAKEKAAAEEAARKEALAEVNRLREQKDAEAAAKKSAEDEKARKAADVAKVLAAAEEADKEEAEKALNRKVGGGGLWGDEPAPVKGKGGGGGGGGGLDAFMKKETAKEGRRGGGGTGGLDAFMRKEQQKDEKLAPVQSSGSGRAAPAKAGGKKASSPPGGDLKISAATANKGGGGGSSGSSPTSPSSSGALTGGSKKKGSPTSPVVGNSKVSTSSPVKRSGAYDDDIELEGVSDSDEEGKGDVMGNNKVVSPDAVKEGKSGGSGWMPPGAGASGAASKVGGGGGADAAARTRAFVASLEAESDDDDDGVMGAIKARSKATVVSRPVVGGANKPKLKWDDDEDGGKPSVGLSKPAPSAPTAKMLQEEELALEVEDDLDAVEIDDEDLDVW